VRLRVGFDARWYNDSGVGTYVAELLRSLAQHQDEIKLVVYESPDNPVQSLQGMSVERVPVLSRKYSVGEQIELSGRCRKDNLHLFHSPFYPVPITASCPVVVTIHDLIPFLFPVYSRLKGIIVKTGYHAAAKKAAQIITDSLNTARDVELLLEASAQKITAVPIAADRSRYVAEQRKGEAAILEEKFGVTGPYVMASSARNWRHKNLEATLNAIELAINSTGMNIQTVIYGPPDGLVAAGGVERWQSIGVTHTGYTAVDELAMLFRHARAFVMPSLYEGFGLPILEAMSCGCPVITSNGGSLPEVAGDGAQIFPPTDVTGMSCALARLLTSDDNLAHWRVAALRQAAQFSWERTARETISVYRKAMQT
jgi:glycosyltransferase involved in cell wall biosynthesis